MIDRARDASARVSRPVRLRKDPKGGGCAYAGDDPVNNTDLSGLEPRQDRLRSCDNNWFKSPHNKAFVSRRRSGHNTLAWGFQLKSDAQLVFTKGAQVSLAVSVNGHYESDAYYHKATRPADYHWHSHFNGVSNGAVVHLYFLAQHYDRATRTYAYSELAFACRA